MKVRDHIAALAQFDPDEEVLPCFPAGMGMFDCAELPSGGNPDAARHFIGSWPNAPREGDTVRETGKRFGANRTWKRVSGQWVLQSNGPSMSHGET